MHLPFCWQASDININKYIIKRCELPVCENGATHRTKFTRAHLHTGTPYATHARQVSSALRGATDRSPVAVSVAVLRPRRPVPGGAPEPAERERIRASDSTRPGGGSRRRGRARPAAESACPGRFPTANGLGRFLPRRRDRAPAKRVEPCIHTPYWLRRVTPGRVLVSTGD